MTRICSLLLILTFVAACSDGNDTFTPVQEPEYLPIATVTAEDPPPGDIYLQANAFDLADVGYEAQEYFISGTASAFTNLNELGTDGLWNVEAANRPSIRLES